jgi:hypothetical protein
MNQTKLFQSRWNGNGLQALVENITMRRDTVDFNAQELRQSIEKDYSAYDERMERHLGQLQGFKIVFETSRELAAEASFFFDLKDMAELTCELEARNHEVNQFEKLLINDLLGINSKVAIAKL